MSRRMIENKLHETSYAEELINVVIAALELRGARKAKFNIKARYNANKGKKRKAETAEEREGEKERIRE